MDRGLLLAQLGHQLGLDLLHLPHKLLLVYAFPLLSHPLLRLHPLHPLLLGLVKFLSASSVGLGHRLLHHLVSLPYHLLPSLLLFVILLHLYSL